jgi:hypothetical protein
VNITIIITISATIIIVIIINIIINIKLLLLPPPPLQQRRQLKVARTTCRGTSDILGHSKKKKTAGPPRLVMCWDVEQNFSIKVFDKNPKEM